MSRTCTLPSPPLLRFISFLLSSLLSSFLTSVLGSRPRIVADPPPLFFFFFLHFLCYLVLVLFFSRSSPLLSSPISRLFFIPLSCFRNEFQTVEILEKRKKKEKGIRNTREEERRNRRARRKGFPRGEETEVGSRRTIGAILPKARQPMPTRPWRTRLMSGPLPQRVTPTSICPPLLLFSTGFT